MSSSNSNHGAKDGGKSVDASQSPEYEAGLQEQLKKVNAAIQTDSAESQFKLSASSGNHKARSVAAEAPGFAQTFELCHQRDELVERLRCLQKAPYASDSQRTNVNSEVVAIFGGEVVDMFGVNSRCNMQELGWSEEEMDQALAVKESELKKDLADLGKSGKLPKSSR